ncbi:hypothetical protein, partial [Niveibacterium umoris]
LRCAPAPVTSNVSHMQTRPVRYYIAAAASALLFARAARADAGVPLLFLTLPGMVLALLPVIAIEAIVLARTFRSNVLSVLKASALANIASTLLGIPITWVVLVLLQDLTGGGRSYGLTTPLQKLLAVTWQAPWLIPYEGDLYWMVPAASLALMVPFFIASVYIELAVVLRIVADNPPLLVRRAVLRSNLLTYAILCFLNAGWLISSLSRGAAHG